MVFEVRFNGVKIVLSHDFYIKHGTTVSLMTVFNAYSIHNFLTIHP